MTGAGLDALRRSQAELHRLDRLAGATAGSITGALSGGERTIAEVDQLVARLEGRLSQLQVAQLPPTGPEPEPGLEPEVGPEPEPGAARPSRPHLLDLALSLLRPGDHVVDVGAGSGDFGFGVAARGCAVLAIAASARDAAALAGRRTQRGFHDLHVVAAAYDMARVDDLVVSFAWPTPTLVRLDVGGATATALDGMAGLLAKTPAPALLATAEGEAVAPLARRGFALYRVEPGRLVCTEASGDGDWLALRGAPANLPGWEVVA